MSRAPRSWLCPFSLVSCLVEVSSSSDPLVYGRHEAGQHILASKRDYGVVETELARCMPAHRDCHLSAIPSNSHNFFTGYCAQCSRGRKWQTDARVMADTYLHATITDYVTTASSNECRHCARRACCLGSRGWIPSASHLSSHWVRALQPSTADTHCPTASYPLQHLYNTLQSTALQHFYSLQPLQHPSGIGHANQGACLAPCFGSKSFRSA